MLDLPDIYYFDEGYRKSVSKSIILNIKLQLRYTMLPDFSFWVGFLLMSKHVLTFKQVQAFLDDMEFSIDVGLTGGLMSAAIVSLARLY